ncbi:DUF397 domain-containing protein [Streptomyces sp. NPDC048584]|uniref:DUF397 domain-containing protein n=1 Tax=Streptomyces sp. NPDC048584 TaxID=3365573 RepID=UPI003711E03C
MRSCLGSEVGRPLYAIAIAPRTIHIRDSKNAAGPQLAVDPVAWASFVAYSSER